MSRESWCSKTTTSWTIGVSFPAEAGIFFLNTSRLTPRSIQPPVQWISGTICSGIKGSVRQTDHSPPSSFKVKNPLGYTYTSPEVSTGSFIITFRKRWCSIFQQYEGISKSFRTKPITKQKKTTTVNTGWEATLSITAAKLARLTHKIAIQLHLLAQSCTISSSRSRRPVRKLLDIPSYLKYLCTRYEDSEDSVFVNFSIVL
jgi:hypothetical protein